MFSDLPPAPVDPILGMARLFAADQSADKVDLGIGVYNDENGRVPVLGSVKVAEQWLVDNQSSKTYLSSAGNADFTTALQALLLGDDGALQARARTVQTPGGTGALRLAADLIRQLRPQARIFVSDPTWANHIPIFAAAGLQIVKYPYYDVDSARLCFEAMLATLESAGPDDVMLLHGCCHNPTGADLDDAQWAALIELLARTGATPLIDMAYLGFAKGLREDAAATRLAATRLPEVMITTSCSKNFSLYRERVGALTIVAASEASAALAFGHLMPVARTNWSMPPDHGAAVVAQILNTPALAAQWVTELEAMRQRVFQMRGRLADCLRDLQRPELGFIAEQNGMFTMLSFQPDQVARLRDRHHVHVTGTGRVNVAGLTSSNVGRVAEAIAAVLS